MTHMKDIERRKCKVCFTNDCAKKGKSINGFQLYKSRCQPCLDKKYRLYKKKFCEFCGFVAVNSVQLDIDHIDGDRGNNNPENLQTLCANCHRLKTFLNNDWKLSRNMWNNVKFRG